MRFNIDFIVSQTEKNYVYWFERRGRGMYLRASPIDVSGILNERLFEKTDTAVLTSATLSSGGGFGFIKNRLGLPDAKTLLAPSSFDYRSQALVYLPRGMPEPRSPEFTSMAAAEIVRLLQITKGRAFRTFDEFLFDERALRTRFVACEFSLFSARVDVESRRSGRVSENTECCAVWDIVILAGR